MEMIDFAAYRDHLLAQSFSAGQAEAYASAAVKIAKAYRRGDRPDLEAVRMLLVQAGVEHVEPWLRSAIGLFSPSAAAKRERIP